MIRAEMLILAISLFLSTQVALPAQVFAGECDQAGSKIVELERQIGAFQKEIEKSKGKKLGKPGTLTRTTLPNVQYPNGVTFTKVTRKGFGEAWRDPSGMIWGDVVKTNKGNVWQANQFEATKYCKSIGAGLPSYADFVRLLGYMRTGSSTWDYIPQVLPNLDGNFLWSSSVHPGYYPSFLDQAFYFNGRYGFIDSGSRYKRGRDDGNVAVRCVAPSSRGK